MKNIKLIILDVDGVLTDGSLYIGSNQVEYKQFNTQDGMGITLAHYAGLKTAIITGRKSEAVTKRAKELKINYVYQGISNKLEVLSELLIELGLTVGEISYMGDDINDLPILKTAGISFAPDNAVRLVKESVDIVTKHSGGNGAVREMVEAILQRQTNFEVLVQEFIYGKNKVIQ
ncbi:3-deoxy-D-manno-octulosonate 8-phosphate phosphatase [Priestia megaterium]|uniref:KdsC family phosphatase n=1 Tax=Priestia megaterium TaxID=1404 RepID=UPI000D3E9453|nr:HAD hydrolase family protein [Priestia megaterium]AWD66030.1 3-deoxy-D-manno-octulosonate 8-phosphate phosphatase [Priestia megaterium]